ncbi:MAG: capping complex subunit for YIEGIA [bacterium]|jgi:hypothetical protein
MEIEKFIVAILATDSNAVSGGYAPVFYFESAAEKEKAALYLSRVLDAAVHALDNGIYFLVKH